MPTTFDASEAGERSDLGRLALPLFPQERKASANPLGMYHSNRESFGASFPLLRADIESQNKRKSSRDFDVVRDSQLERENILYEQREIHNFLERKADQTFLGECAAQTRLSEAQSELDRREWKMQSAGRAHHEWVSNSTPR